MKVRYKQGRKGLEAVAKVYDASEHGIDQKKIDRDAVRTVERLSNAGYEAYIVGGAVRDLLLGRFPKDFDIATSATPRQVHKLFRNSRLIGRRFRLVHVVYGEKIFEVSTFRGESRGGDGENCFGTIEEDAKRRDFSINALYYNPLDRTLLDFVNGMEDIRKKRLTSLIPLKHTFKDDPVRMIRAVKYAQKTGFRFRAGIGHAIRRDRALLGEVSASRLTEETNKILGSGCSCAIMRSLDKYGLLVYLLPALSQYTGFQQLFDSLAELDQEVIQGKKSGNPVTKGRMFYGLAAPFIAISQDIRNPNEMNADIFRQVKVLLSPNTPSNADVEDAVLMFMRRNGLKTPRKRLYPHNVSNDPLAKVKMPRLTGLSQGC